MEYLLSPGSVGLNARCSAEEFETMRIDRLQSCGHLEDGEGVVGDWVPQFDFRPIHRMYTYTSGGTPARTVIVLEVNLPSGVSAEMISIKVNDEGNAVLMGVKWPRYMLEPILFNASWLSASGDGSLRETDSKMTQSQMGVQRIMRSYGTRSVESSARFKLPCTVERRAGSVNIKTLAFIHENDGGGKPNGYAVQVEMIAVEDLSYDIFGKSVGTQFVVVDSTKATSQEKSGTTVPEIVISSTVTDAVRADETLPRTGGGDASERRGEQENAENQGE